MDKRELVERAMRQQMRVPVSATRFDPKLARVDTAVKAIWQLFRWERWELLESLGVEREKYAPIFKRFDEEHISTDHGLIESPSHVQKLIQLAGPGLVARALEVIERYQMMTKASRKDHYAQNANERQIGEGKIPDEQSTISILE